MRIIIALLAFALLVVFVAAAGQTATLEDFRYEVAALFDQPWAFAALANLYVGYALTAIVMMIVERSVIAGVLWAAPMLVIGNVWAAFWLLVRLGRLTAMTKPTVKADA